MYGRPPFMAPDDPMAVFKMILNDKIKFPKDFDRQGKKLIRKLTERDLTKRLGNLKNGTDDVLKHKFFAEIDWQKLLQAKEPAIYVPPHRH